MRSPTQVTSMRIVPRKERHAQLQVSSSANKLTLFVDIDEGLVNHLKRSDEQASCLRKKLLTLSMNRPAALF